MRLSPYLLLLMLLALSACEEEIDYESTTVDIPQRLVVDCWLTDLPETQYVRLQKSRNVSDADQEPEMITGAEVSIAYNTTELLLNEETPGSYATPTGWQAEAGTTYHLHIFWEGSTWTASAYMQPAADFEVLTLVPANELASNPGMDLESWWGIRFLTNQFGYDNPSRWDLYRILPDSIISTHPDSVQDQLRNPEPVVYYTHPSLQTDGLLNFETVDNKIFPGGTIVRQIRYGLSEEHYAYLSAVLSESDWSGGLFDPTPGNVPSNITNNGLGWFGASGTLVKEQVAGQ